MNIFQINFNIFAIFLINSIRIINSATYEFVYDNVEIFDKCSGETNDNDFKSGFDMSDMIVEYDDGSLHCQGNVTIVWDVEPTDRIEYRADIFKFIRGTWQPTVVTIFVPDFCAEMFKTSAMWYSIWTSNIDKEDRVCLNQKGHILHHQPFDVIGKWETVYGIEGRLRIHQHLNAYDENNVKRPTSLCFEIFGELVKVKNYN